MRTLRRRWIIVLTIIILVVALPLFSYAGVLSLANKTYGIFLCGGYPFDAGVFPCSISGVNGLDGYGYMSNVQYGSAYTTLHDKVAQLKQQGYTRIVGIGYSAGADAFAYEMTHNFDDYYAVALIGLPWFDSSIESVRQVKTNVIIINGGSDTTAVPSTAYEWYLWLPDSITKEFKILSGFDHISLGFLNDQTQAGGVISQFVAGTYPKQEDTFTSYVNGNKVGSNSQVTVINPTIHFQVQVSSKVSEYFKTTYEFMQVYELPSWTIIGRLNPDSSGVDYAGDISLSQGSHKIALAGGDGAPYRPILELDLSASTEGQSYLAIASLGVLVIMATVIGIVIIRRRWPQ